MTAMALTHTIAPFCPEDARILILGSFPSPKSREMGFYYGHPQNRFWRVLAGLFGEEEPLTVSERKAFLAAHRIALWDVLASCRIEGASDASIKEAQPNDLNLLLTRAPIAAVFTTGKKAGQLLQKFWKDALPVPVIALPSTSPANCRLHLDDLIDAYKVIVDYL
jgi:TDG/mug DNA glycosylase family protein